MNNTKTLRKIVWIKHLSILVKRCLNASILLFLLSICTIANAAWFSSTGQAVIVNGDRERAKSEAIEEAIKQALLFSGASVRSVQHLANGLLTNDHLEIRASGEVNTIELIDEIYEDGVLTVSIRADIFAHDTKCSAADYTKRIATTYFPIAFPAQASDGQIHSFGNALGKRFPRLFNQVTTNLAVSNIEPYALDWMRTNSKMQSQALASKTNTQYVIGAVIKDLSINRARTSGLKFWSSPETSRAFAFELTLFDGASGEPLMSKHYETTAPWDFSYTQSVDVNSDKFWRSNYGKAVDKLVQEAVVDLEQETMCEATKGRILAIANNQLQINLGRNQKVQTGDQLTLFSVKEVQDTFGQTYKQFVLHPTVLVVEQVFAETATLTSIDGSLLANVQANDYVARQ
ncbi:flagella assembly protein FlgT [Glaciecola sp. KUL10]|uniref:flagella assembly protein FlgT n=1 Tax=Glaciecola sp. (strain KUL10) TaxID=2161813 RepID=UPI000D78699D|nr:flagella assembly protein FlgT [Glaciecola sp. KUL10]